MKWRLHAIDTPEIGSPECPQEYETGIEARDRLRDLMGTGYAIDWIGEQGSYDRELVNIRLSGGRDAGVMLIEEGLAQPWPNDGNVWCGF
ncbi:MAG: thermonuclease family protein [Hyphomicrobiaceae bacterium]|nr:thermonuclease family protein [Hyphomicrobiaceae bacterium]